MHSLAHKRELPAAGFLARSIAIRTENEGMALPPCGRKLARQTLGDTLDRDPAKGSPCRIDMYLVHIPVAAHSIGRPVG